MSLIFEANEAFMAVGIAIVLADKKCSEEETGMMLRMFKVLKILNIQDRIEYEKTWEQIFERTFAKIKQAFPDRYLEMNEQHLDRLIAAVKQTLGVESYETLFHLAAAIAIADGLDLREKLILYRLQKELNISPEVAEKFLVEPPLID